MFLSRPVFDLATYHDPGPGPSPDPVKRQDSESSQALTRLCPRISRPMTQERNSDSLTFLVLDSDSVYIKLFDLRLVLKQTCLHHGLYFCS